jgi:hypothetical protein
MDEVIDWLLERKPWGKYRSRVDLLGQSESGTEVIHARKEMVEPPKLQSFLRELENYSFLEVRE